jgi:hypothetical protein
MHVIGWMSGHKKKQREDFDDNERASWPPRHDDDRGRFNTELAAFVRAAAKTE